MNTTDKIMALADDVIDHAWNDGMRRKDKFMGERTLAARQALRAEIETLVRDAERYRWLRDEAWGGNNRSGPHLVVYRPGLMPSAVTELAEDAADTAIDAAMQEKQS